MLNPVVLPLPMALLVIGALVVAALLGDALRRTSDVPTWPVWAAQTPAAAGRHRLAAVAEPYRPRPWVQVTAEAPIVAEPVQYGLLDHQVPLAEVEEYLRAVSAAPAVLSLVS